MKHAIATILRLTAIVTTLAAEKLDPQPPVDEAAINSLIAWSLDPDNFASANNGAANNYVWHRTS